MIFVFDIDDTISDTDAYSEYYIAKFFADNNLPFKQIKKVSRFAEGKFDWDMDTALKWYKKFGDQMMLEFPTKPGAVETVNKLHSMGHRIILATARADNWHTNPQEITAQWVKNKGIMCDRLYVGRDDKEQICIEEEADLFVDDDIKICSAVLEHSKKTTPLLMSTAYNSALEKPENLKTISNLSEVLKFVK